MTATPGTLAGVEALSDHNPIPAFGARALAANEQVGKNQIITVAPATGLASLNDGSVAGQIPLGTGWPNELSDKSAMASAAWVRYSMRHVTGFPESSVTNDAFLSTDFLKPAYIVNENCLGKLAYTGADATLAKRSLGGLMMGLDPNYPDSPVFWISPYAYILARAMIANDNAVVARDVFALTANTTRAEAVLPRANSANGRVVKVRVVAAGGFTSHDNNYWTFTVAKRTATTPGTAVTIATATLKTTNGGGIGTLTAFKYADLVLTATSADLEILEGDVLTVTCTSETTAAAIGQLTIEVIAKVAA